jgi:anti-sigma B factor antagonist
MTTNPMDRPASKLTIEERILGDVVILTLSGEITADDGDIAFGKRVDELVLRQGHRKVLVDLAGVTYIDSAGVGIMVGEYQIVRNTGGALKLLNLTSRSHRLLAMMKLRSVFEIFDDEAMAIRSFTRH